jgi:uncharacterized protein
VPELFTIETDLVQLNWSVPRERTPFIPQGVSSPPGRLIVRECRPGLKFGTGTWRADVPDAVKHDPAETVGPRLYEQTDYSIYVRGKSDLPLALESRDPNLTRGLAVSDGGRTIYGLVNFGSQVGLTEFQLRIGAQVELEFEAEVFPTKLDYLSDYQQLLAEVQEILTGLVLEYLRSTFQLGTASKVPQPTQLEWLTLLRHVAGELRQAIDTIAQRPQWALAREPQLTRVERARRPDSAVRSAISRGKGAGRLLKLSGNVSLREQIPESKPRPTLDTPEHRWLAAQLSTIRRHLAVLRQEEMRRDASDRRDQAIREIDGLLSLVGRLAQSPPLVSTSGAPPSGFASLQLLKAPGYREAYRACLVLMLGLRLEGGPVRLSVKDLSLLYEYWCLLALVRLVAEQTGQAIPVRQLVAVEQQGLRVLLQKGREHTVRFPMSHGRRISVTYNPLFKGESVLTPQQPDMLMTVEDPDWPMVRLVLDAKYRLETSPEYLQRYGSPGPPEDAINVLHRYRDAILDLDSRDIQSERPKRTVIQATALFPHIEQAPGQFSGSRLWEALNRLGIGALPFLPGSTRYVADWLRSNLTAGGWAIADRAIPHRAQERAQDWRVAASEVVLVGVLRGGTESLHLQWISENKAYYVPLLRTQRRQYATKYVAIYSSAALRNPGAVTHVAEVVGIDIVRRGNISTPWATGTDDDDLYVLFRLGALERLARPVLNQRNERSGVRFSTHRWTSRLGLLRAASIEELFLETEPEWRLYEDLRVAGIPFHLQAGRPRLPDSEDPRGRAWFVAPSGRAQYRGSAGFYFRSGTAEAYYARAEDVAVRLAS